MAKRLVKGATYPIINEDGSISISPDKNLSQSVISSSPPEGYKEVTKIYVHLETGELLVEHEL